ncbi:MAG: hypothetical protein RIB67_03270 [Miltoncostaeaceae bacterium]
MRRVASGRPALQSPVSGPTLTPRAGSITFTRAGVGANRLTDIRALDMLTCVNANLD